MMRTVICGLALASLSGLAFAQSQPASSDVSERERVLLERIERLERRLNEVETRLNATAADRRTTTAAPAPPLQLTPAPPLQLTNVAPRQSPAHPMATTASPQQPTQTGQAQTGQAQTARAPRSAPTPSPTPFAAWEKGGVKIIPYGMLIANVNYNTSGLDPGSIVGFAFPDIPTTVKQFNISPGNTLLGIDFKWPKIGEWEINGKLDFDLRGPTPLRSNNIFAPLFIHVYGEAKTERYRILAGQAEDFISPLISNSVNTYPFSYVPGKLGFFRPQVRFETYQPIGDDFTFIFQGALTQAIQTFQVADEVIGDQSGLPDGQIRLALGYGKRDRRDQYQRRPFELGVSGHIGKRSATRLGILLTGTEFTTWSGDIDLSLKIGRKLRFDFEFFGGSVLGDYAGGVFQTFNPVRLTAIRASGAWAQLTYDISDKWQVNGGYGRDDPYNRDLAFAQRSLNASGFGNFYYRITPRLWVAMEFSRWRTDWVGIPGGRAFRVEPAVFFIF